MLPVDLIDSRLIRCAICGGHDIHHWFRMDFGSIGRCGRCGEVLRADKPQRDAQVTLHQTSNLHETPYALRSEVASVELAFYGRFLDLCEKTVGCGKILDIGCSTGEFLKLAVGCGFDVAGIEPIAELREIAERALGGRPIKSQPIEEAEFEAESFDAVTMWDVVEHLIDPRGTLMRLHWLLKPGGYLGIATLNHASLMYVIYHALRWIFPPLARPVGPMLYNPFHTYYFTKKSLARLVQNARFDIVEHRGYEFPISRLHVGLALKFGMRALYVFQGILGMQGEQYVFARKS
jgi:2-polyprenyl-3-methyl-5-hydroxy-6-metoxy-1,4-benzoquinol methylase